MNCPNCGATLPGRGTTRVFVTGGLLIASGFLLLFIIHLAVVVLASVILVVFGSTMLRGARNARYGVCPSCRTRLRR